MHVTLTTFHIAVNSQILAHNEPYTHTPVPINIRTKLLQSLN